MTCTLTHYRRPHPRYCRAPAGWRPATGWEVVDGRIQRGWAGPRGGRRRAVIWRTGGAWTWSVREWRGGVWAEIARALPATERPPYWAAQQAMPFAELAARTK